MFGGKVKARGSRRIGTRHVHARLYFTQNGWTSTTYKVGPWSWNTRRERHRVDLPGPWHWESHRTRRDAS